MPFMADMWFLFAHGAGASSQSAWMGRWASRLEALGPVRRFDYPYMRAGRKRPDPLPRLVEAHREQLQEGRRIHGSRAILVGKSMGGRVGCHLALEDQVLGVVCLGYPLVGMGKTSRMRDQILLDLAVPACFIQGTRDRLCPLPLLEEVLRKRTAPSSLHLVESGDHSLEATKGYLRQSAQTQDDLEARALAEIQSFLTSLG